jgi:hypothetical protein
MAGLAPLQPVIHGDPSLSIPHIVNLAIPGVEAETVMDAWAGSRRSVQRGGLLVTVLQV